MRVGLVLNIWFIIIVLVQQRDWEITHGTRARSLQKQGLIISASPRYSPANNMWWQAICLWKFAASRKTTWSLFARTWKELQRETTRASAHASRVQQQRRQTMTTPLARSLDISLRPERTTTWMAKFIDCLSLINSFYYRKVVLRDRNKKKEQKGKLMKQF